MATILSTKKLTSSQKEPLLNANIDVVDENFIEIEPINFECNSIVENAIFTSKNSVINVLNRNITIKNCFCVGDKTAALLLKNGFCVVEKASQAVTLAEKIIEKHAHRDFVFFCGTIRRPELPLLLKKKNISLEEIKVYKTVLTAKRMMHHFDGILFFSPSAVQSYSQQNLFNDTTTVFCLGKTTKREAKKHTNNIIISNRNTIENVIVQVIKYFNKN